VSAIPAAIPAVMIVKPALPIVAGLVAMLGPVLADFVAVLLPVLAQLAPVAIRAVLADPGAVLADPGPVLAAEPVPEHFQALFGRFDGGTVTAVGPAVAQARQVAGTVTQAAKTHA